MKKNLAILFTLAFSFIFCGCSNLTLTNGKYQIPDQSRQDYACVYDNLIFLNVKAPENKLQRNSYMQWAGKYTVEANGEIFLNMPRELNKEWRFYFSFLKTKDGIVVNDLSSGVGFLLKYELPEKRSFPKEPVIETYRPMN
jgi:hypothetical protein